MSALIVQVVAIMLVHEMSNRWRLRLQRRCADKGVSLLHPNLPLTLSHSLASMRLDGERTRNVVDHQRADPMVAVPFMIDCYTCRFTVWHEQDSGDWLFHGTKMGFVEDGYYI